MSAGKDACIASEASVGGLPAGDCPQGLAAVARPLIDDAGRQRGSAMRRNREAEQVCINDLLRQSITELEYLKFALDQHSVVSVTDLDGTIVYVNPKFSDISGYDREELIGQNHRLLKSGVHAPAFYEDMWRRISAGEVWHGDIANRAKNGEIYWVASTIVPLVGENGLPVRYISIRTDITALKRTKRALDEARQRELQIGQQIQRTLLQQDAPNTGGGAWIATYTEPSEGIDGDFFAFTRFDARCFELLVGDVMGKGVPAAMMGAAVKTAYHLATTELLAATITSGRLHEPADLMNLLHEQLTPKLIGLEAFVTAALYRFDLDAGTVTYVNAGHTNGMLLREGAQAPESVCGDNLPLGVLEEERYAQRQLRVGPGDRLLVYSDGITDAHDAAGQPFDEGRLRQLLLDVSAKRLPPDLCLQAIRLALRSFTGSASLFDDQTAVMVDILAGASRPADFPSEDEAIFALPRAADQLGKLRRRLATVQPHLGERATAGLILGAFEVASNIIKHATPIFPDDPIICRIRLEGDTAAVELWHSAHHFQPPARLDGEFGIGTESGFGLFIIQNAAERVEYDSPLPGICCTRLTARRR